ncbi:MAG: hypothetical protein ABJE95_21200 [Byssovorax sp.]
MEDSLAVIVSRIENGSSEERILALDDYQKQFSVVMSAAVKALVADGVDQLFIADRIMRFAHVVRRALLSLEIDASNPETRYLRALILCQFGDRSELPFLSSLASESGPYQYDTIRQLAFLRVPEVQVPILDQLRGAELSNSDVIVGMLHAWKLFGNPLPDDLRRRLGGEGVPPAISVALKVLELG